MVCVSFTLPMDRLCKTSHIATQFKYIPTLMLLQGMVAACKNKIVHFYVNWPSWSARCSIKMSWGRVRIVTAPPVALTGRSHGSDDSSCIVNRQRRSPWPCLHGLFKSPPAGQIISTRITPYRVVPRLSPFSLTLFYLFFYFFACLFWSVDKACTGHCTLSDPRSPTRCTSRLEKAS